MGKAGERSAAQRREHPPGWGRDGNRVRKVWEHSGLRDERIYLGAWEIYRRWNGSTKELERETLHVMDGVRRVAMVETKTVDSGAPPFTPTPRLRLQLTNHLQTAHLEVDGTGLVISYEEMTPYGTSSYRSAASAVEVSARRYRYTGKERGEETGLDYFGARHYAPWLGRWTTADPLGLQAGLNLYLYGRASPVVMVDPNGMDSASAVDDWVQLGKAVGERLFGGNEASEPSELVLTGEDPKTYLDQPTTVADSDDSSPPAPGFGADLYRQDAAAQGGSDSLGADLMRGLFPSAPALMGPIKGPEGLPQGLAQLQAGANQEVASKGGNSAVLIGEIGSAWINLQTFVAEAALGVGTAALRTSAIRSLPEVATEGAAQQAAKQGATTVAEGAAQRLTVTFGRDPNQVSHAFRHVDKMGLVRAEVQAAIERHLPTVVENIPKGRPLNQIIEVAGKRIQYSAFRLPDGSINIGRIHGVP